MTDSIKYPEVHITAVTDDNPEVVYSHFSYGLPEFIALSVFEDYGGGLSLIVGQTLYFPTGEADANGNLIYSQSVAPHIEVDQQMRKYWQNDPSRLPPGDGMGMAGHQYHEMIRASHGDAWYMQYDKMCDYIAWEEEHSGNPNPRQVHFKNMVHRPPKSLWQYFLEVFRRKEA